MSSIQLPTLTETSISHVRESERGTKAILPGTLDVTWSAVDVPRIDGETYYEARSLFVNLNNNNSSGSSASSPLSSSSRTIPVVYRAHTELPLCDAVSLLLGEDHTGLMAWEGSKQLLRWFAWLMDADKLPSDVGTTIPPQTTTLSSSAPAKNTTTSIVELGAGCGFLSVGLMGLMSASSSAACANNTAYSTAPTSIVAALQQRLFASSSSHICVTDGSDECVDLINKNIQLFEQLRHRISNNKVSNNSTSSSSVSARGAGFWWGKEETARKIVADSSAKLAKLSDLVIVAGDVVYGIEAVEPLAKAARDLASAHLMNTTSTTNDDGSNAPTVSWVLSWMPRSLTQVQNLALFDSLINEMVSPATPTTSTSTGCEQWVLKQVFLREIPAGAQDNMKFTHMQYGIDPQTLFGAARDDAVFKQCAINGCIICFSWE